MLDSGEDLVKLAAMIQESLEDKELVLETYKKAGGYFTSYKEIMNLGDSVLKDTGNKVYAGEIYLKAAETDPETPKLVSVAGKLADEIGDTDGAVKVLHQAENSVKTNSGFKSMADAVLKYATDQKWLEDIGLQYRYMGGDYEGPGPWITIEEVPAGVYSNFAVDGSPGTFITWRPDALASGQPPPSKDGIYELRAYSVCSATGALGYSNVSTGTIDRNAPVVFGLPQPADGELSLGEYISVTFNEPLDCAAVEAAIVTLKYVDGPKAGEMIPVTTVCNGESIVLVPQVESSDMDGWRLEASVDSVTDRVGNSIT